MNYGLYGQMFSFCLDLTTSDKTGQKQVNKTPLRVLVLNKVAILAAQWHRGNTFLRARCSILLVSVIPVRNYKTPPHFKLVFNVSLVGNEKL